jgi:hypothetical protein
MLSLQDDGASGSARYVDGRREIERDPAGRGGPLKYLLGLLRPEAAIRRRARTTRWAMNRYGRFQFLIRARSRVVMSSNRHCALHANRVAARPISQ